MTYNVRRTLAKLQTKYTQINRTGQLTKGQRTKVTLYCGGRTPTWNHARQRNSSRTSTTSHAVRRLCQTNSCSRHRQAISRRHLQLNSTADFFTRPPTSSPPTSPHFVLHHNAGMFTHVNRSKICPPLRPVKLSTSHYDPKTRSSQISFHQSHALQKHSTRIIQILFDW